MQKKDQSSDKDEPKIYYFSSSVLKDYQMYREMLHETALSQESSDIAPIHQSKFDESFKQSSQEISGVTLFHDLNDKNLLKQPSLTEQELNELYGQAATHVLFDSIVTDLELENKEIEEARKNKMLMEEISNLYKIKQEKQEKLSQLKSKVAADKNIQEQGKKIYEKLQLQTNEFKDIFHSPEWSGKLDHIMVNQNQAFGFVKEGLEKYSQQSSAKLQELKIKQQALLGKEQQLKRTIQQINQEIERKRVQRKKRLIDEKIDKQNREIENLQQSIRKMQTFLGRK